MDGPGLRERKKQATRRRIAETAFELFAERGFEDVTVAEVAAATEVSSATVFNYFRTKEDLIFDGVGPFQENLLAACRERPEGQSVREAFRTFLLQPRGALHSQDPDAVERIARAARIIAASPTLRARERLDLDRTTRALAAVISDDGIEDPRAWATAHALMGVTRVMTAAVHRGALAGDPARTIAADVLRAGEEAFDAVG